MHIVFNINNAYVQHMCVTMLSILEYVSEDVKFHVLSSDVSESNKNYIRQLVSKHNCDVEFHYVDKNLLKNAPLGRATVNTKITVEAYYRLLIPSILPTDIEKVIYLDCDIVAIGDIAPLWHTDITNYCLAAVDDIDEKSIEHIVRLELDENYRYFNSGVLVLNLTRLRNMDFVNKAIECITTQAERLILHDQDVLNILLYKERLPIDSGWNDIYSGHYEDSVLIHFILWHPWYVECDHPLRGEYMKYKKRTKWANKKLQHFHPWQVRLQWKIDGIKRKRIIPIVNFFKAILKKT